MPEARSHDLRRACLSWRRWVFPLVLLGWSATGWAGAGGVIDRDIEYRLDPTPVRGWFVYDVVAAKYLVDRASYADAVAVMKQHGESVTDIEDAREGVKHLRETLRSRIAGIEILAAFLSPVWIPALLVALVVVLLRRRRRAVVRAGAGRL